MYCGLEDRTARVVKSETVRVDGSSSVELLNLRERHLGPVKTVAEAALGECMSILKSSEPNLAWEEVAVDGKRFLVRD